MKHSLFSQNEDRTIKWYDKFDADKIKKDIVQRLEEDPTDVIEHCKEYSKEDIKKYYGNEIINFYKVNRVGKPSKVILKGDKEYYQPLD